ncbi:MAG: OB-fold nucleic acid binding domain-containing protein [Candidatus Hodarchaeota archaeon]
MGKAPCPRCKGKKIIQKSETCPTCKGIGSKKLVMGGGGLRNKGDVCKTCNGSGKITKESECSQCNGQGTVLRCDLCGKVTPDLSNGLCSKCESNPLVYQLGVDSFSQIKVGMPFIGKVVTKKDFGYFVSIGGGIDGLVRAKGGGLVHEGDEKFVRVTKILADNKLELEAFTLNRPYKVRRLQKPIKRTLIRNLSSQREKTVVVIRGVLEKIQKTSGPISYAISDESGDTIECVIFLRSGEKNPYASIHLQDVVDVVGIVGLWKGRPQVEIESMEKVAESAAAKTRQKIEQNLEELAQVDATAVPSVIKTPRMDEIIELLIPIAKNVRKAVFSNQPIVLRHHADADGICSGLAIEHAIRGLMRNTFDDPEERIRHNFARRPSRSPFYDSIDVTKDISFALEDFERFGAKLPLLIFTDLGSSDENEFPFKKASFYFDLLVVDHHFPSLDQNHSSLIGHVNSYFVEDGDYNISGGMLGVELARLIFPPTYPKICHLGAVAGLADRVEGPELEQYLETSPIPDKGFLRDVGIAIDYEAHNLRFSEGRSLLDDLLGIDEETEDASAWTVERQRKLVEVVASEAKRLMDEALQVAFPHVVAEVSSPLSFYSIDVESYTARFSYPPPGKLTGAIHDRICEKDPEGAIITLGIGPDFIILRSRNAVINFPEAVQECGSRLPEAGVEGGGHEVVGTLKFVSGLREQVIDALKEILRNQLS